ncbi:hypothetical protein HMSSN139_55000 [Paenibacillus sp. HMSSN-139]|nr:hypothetical protein HMSSN139_55000 [Paenibacillus sp. HMSSN-139]
MRRLTFFSWALNQPSEETYDFAQLDETIDRLYKSGIHVCLATSTGAHPAWMAHKYPDVLRVDVQGRKRRFGGRHNSCPNSPTYRKYSARLAGKLAERYKDHPGLLIWHISNEYGGYCYCDNCAAAFRVWLRERYQTLDELNRVWNTRFWGHTFYDWEEIVVPNELSEEWGGSRTNFQGISLDYRRFQSESLLECYKLEYDEIKKHTPNVPVTTNLMGLYPELDYFEWAKHMDIVSWDNYPSLDTPVSHTAMTHDLMRGLKSGAPFMLMEQTPSQQNWQPYNSLKRPGVMRLWSYQAVARGADTVMFFQLRRSIGACEKYHGAVIEHVGHEHTRVFREVAELGRELEQLGDTLLDARTEAKVGIVYDWENRWAIELSSGPTVALNYANEVHKYYDALFQMHVESDMVSVEEDFGKYEIVIAPVMYMVKPGFAKKSRGVRGGRRNVHHHLLQRHRKRKRPGNNRRVSGRAALRAGHLGGGDRRFAAGTHEPNCDERSLGRAVGPIRMRPLVRFDPRRRRRGAGGIRFRFLSGHAGRDGQPVRQRPRLLCGEQPGCGFPARVPEEPVRGKRHPAAAGRPNWRRSGAPRQGQQSVLVPAEP